MNTAPPAAVPERLVDDSQREKSPEESWDTTSGREQSRGGGHRGGSRGAGTFEGSDSDTEKDSHRDAKPNSQAHPVA